MEVPSSPPECLTSPKDEPQSLSLGLDCSSPLGLFDKFRLDDFPVHEDENDDDLQLVSLVQAPDIASEKKVDDDVVDLDTWDTPDAAQVKVRRRKSMLWVVNANTLCPVKNRREEDQCRLIGSWDTDSAELRRMEELEDPWEDDDLYIVEQDISSPLNEKSDEDDVICVEIADSRGLSKPYGNNVFVKRKCSDHLHADQTTPKRKRKMSEKQKAQAPIPKPVEMAPEDVRNNTVQTLSDVLLKRVHDTPDLLVLDETIRRVAGNVEEEMYKLFSCTDNRYKNKYRSLHFNLRDPKNKVFFQRVVLGEITPECLVLMTATEMAGQELADWRNQERRHTLELIEREEREPRQTNITKLTHKGLIEIDTMPDQNLTLEDLSDSVWQNKNVQPEKTTKDATSQHETAQLECTSEKKDTTSHHEDAQLECTIENKDTTSQHKSHLLDQNCLICTGVVNPPDEADLTQWIKKSGNKRKRSKTDGSGNPSNCLKKGKKKTDPHPDLTDLVPSGVWKGFIHMFSIKQFKVTGTQVSGYNSHLCQALPSVLTSKGCICPESVWEHVDRIWPECTKDMCVMQLNPRTSSDAIAYTRVYSYLNRKVRYGIIRCENMEAFLVPLPASQPIPQRLHPLGGPGLEDNHPMLLLAVLLPNHPSSTAFPKKQCKKQQENVDIPDDIFSDILADVEREERQMAEHGLPPPGIPGLEQFHQTFGEEAVGEEVDRIMNMLRILTSNIQLPGAYPDTTGEDQGPNIMPYFFQPNVLPTGVPFPPFPTYPEDLYPGWHGMIPSAQTAHPMPIDPNMLFPYPLSQVIPPNLLPDQNFAAGGQPYI